MRALSIRQPFAELILRGMKRVEYHSRPTRIVGELTNGLALFPKDLPTGVIVETARIERVEARAKGTFAWHLTDVGRLSNYRNPRGHPQSVRLNPN